MTSSELIDCIFRDHVCGGGRKLGDRLPTTRQLMEKYNSSLPTVGKALHVLEGEGWILKAQGRGITLRKVPADGANSTRNHQIIGIILPDLGGGLMIDVLHGVEQKTRAAGAFLKTAASGGVVEKERGLIVSMHAAGISGIILYPALRKQNAREFLADEFNDLPIVAVDQASSDMKRSAVTFDNFSAGADMTEHCLANNRQRVSFMNMGTSVQQRAVNDRFEGYLSALRKADIAFDPSLVIEIPVENGIIEHGLAIAMRRFLEIHPLPDAILLPTDNYAWLMIQYLKSQGIHAPKDILVCGFDNLQDKYWGCRFPTTNPSFYHMGVRAADLLFDVIKDGNGNVAAIQEIVLPCPVLGAPLEEPDYSAQIDRAFIDNFQSSKRDLSETASAH